MIRRWQKKMHFLSITLKVVYVMSTHISGLLEDDTLEAVRYTSVWENNDYICIGHILNGMSNSMFDIYHMVDSTNELSNSIESRYMADDASSKKFLIRGWSVGEYLSLKDDGYVDTLECLGYPMPQEPSVSLILNSLSKDYEQFVQIYNMHSMMKTIVKLHFMLKLTEEGILIKADTIKEAVKAIGNFDLVLPIGLLIALHNCDYSPFIVRGVVSLSRLVDNGYIHTFTNYGISVSKDDVYYFNVIPRDGIYEVDMHDLVSNNSYIYNISNKRAKRALDYLFLWYCLLGHINMKCIETLQHDGILQPADDESFDKCKSCIFRKMVRKPFLYQTERAKELLGLIHTDVCDPFRTMSREGASYFITVTDDFSCYGQGCEELVKRDTPGKLKFRSIKCIFVGYLKETMGYYFNNLERNKILVARYAEKQLGAISNRIPQAPDRYGFYVDAKEYELGDLNEPPNYKVALLDPKSDKWVEAMNAKMQSLKDNQVWCLVDLPHDGRTIGSKCPFKKIPIWMAKYILLKLVLWEKIIPKPIGQIMRELSLLLYTLEL
ncbi:retrotransposon protein, putative, ty1-copia subclass [Tanacetum coccineum]|uniref:Retrotransposon protein, putative, ty1-copia subclass n=1 Tax=Tanacetum coccineum TaxID=301880 RepID=A0ABQ4XRS0_9ASTR